MKAEPHSERKHARLAPSSIKMNMECLVSIIPPPGGKKDTDTEYSIEGTIAHELLEAVCTHDMKGFKLYKPKNPEHGKYLTKEMKDHIYECYKVIRKIHSTIGEKNLFRFVHETKVKYSTHIFGTLDVGWLYIKNGVKKAIVFDLKYGKGVAVAAERNAQLMTYLVALCETYEGFDAEEGSIMIYQPRNFELSDKPLSTWKVGEKDIKQWRSALKKFEKKALPILEHIDGTLTEKIKLPKEVVGDHCQFCPRKPNCEAYRKEASVSGVILLGDAKPIPTVPAPYRVQNGQKIKDAPVVIQPQMLTMEQKIEVWRKAPMIQSFIKAVTKDLITHALHGKKIPGLKVVEGRSSRKWIANETMVGEYLVKLGVEEPFIKKLKTLTEIEKKIGKKKLGDYTYFAPSKPKLVDEDDDRPAIKNNDAAKLLGTLDDLDEDE